MVRPRVTCKICRKKIDRIHGPCIGDGIVCSIECAMVMVLNGPKPPLTRADIETLSESCNNAQSKFNQYILARDQMLPCISCGRHKDGKHSRHASHFLNKKDYPYYRYNTFNVHVSCQQCNRQLSGNLLKYRKGLIDRVGLARVQLFDSETWTSQPRLTDLFTKDYVSRLGKIFARRARLAAPATMKISAK